MEENIIIPKEDWKTVVTSLTRIEILLAGSGMGDSGMIKDFKDVKDKLQKIEDKDNQRKDVMWVLGILWIGLVAIGEWIAHK